MIWIKSCLIGTNNTRIFIYVTAQDKNKCIICYITVQLLSISISQIQKQNTCNAVAVIWSHFTGIQGYDFYIDSYGDSEGNYSLLRLTETDGKLSLRPVGVYQMNATGHKIPVGIVNIYSYIIGVAIAK